MNRKLYLCKSPYHAFQNLVQQGIVLPKDGVTPTPKAAKALGITHISLSDYAKQALERQGIGLAPAILAHRLLRESVRQLGGYVDIAGTANSLAPSIKELLHANINLQKLQQHPSSRISSLATVADSYQTKLRANGLIDPAELFVEARKHIQERSPLFIYGYTFLSPDELAFLDVLANDDSMIFMLYGQHDLFLENQEAVILLKDRGWQTEVLDDIATHIGGQLSNTFISDALPPAEVDAFVYPHLEEEVRGTLRQVKRLMLNGVTANEIVIVARDDVRYGPTLLSVGWEYDIPIRALYGIPLSETRFGGWIRLLVEVIQEKLPYEQTLRLFSHPFSACLGSEQLNKARYYHPQQPKDWQWLGIDTRPLDWPTEATGKDWVVRLEKLFKSFSIQKRMERLSRELMAYQQLLDALPLLECVQDSLVSRDNFIIELLETLQLLTVPVQPGRGGVELHTPLALFGSRYRHVFVLGMAEGLLPAQVKNDLRLDFFDRAGLIEQGINLKGIEKSAFHEGLSFYSLLQIATESITLSYPRLIRNKEMLESPYFTQLNLVPKSPEKQFLGSLEEARRAWLTTGLLEQDAALPHIKRALDIEQNREGFAPWDEYDGVIGMPFDPTCRPFSVSELSNFGQCPFRWFTGRLLYLSEPEESEQDLSGKQKGILYHKVLELLGQWAQHEDDSQAAMLARLEEAFFQAETEQALPKMSAWAARRTEHLEIMRRVIRSPEFLPQGNRIHALETSFEGPWHGLQVRGKIDRIDQTLDGWVFIDYKTSSSKPKGIQDSQHKLTQDLQLPLYIEAAQPCLFPGESVQDAYYFSITKGKILGHVDLQQSQALQSFAESFKQSLQDGNYPVKPDVKGDACKYCEMDLVCRKGPRLSRKGVAE